MDRKKFLRSKKLYLFDMDGTLYCGSRLFPFTAELLQTLKATGRKYMFMTNNSSAGVEDYIRKLAGMGIEAFREEFITSAQATVQYLLEHYAGDRLYVCGTESVRREFRQSGLSLPEDPDQAQAVVICLDSELTYEKLRTVCSLLSSDRKIPLIATHPDKVCPSEFGMIPDCGSICDMIFTCTGRKPDAVVGKPSPLMPELAMTWRGCTREETIVVGDRINTDVLSGIRAGVSTVLVLSGEADLQTLEQSEEKPDLVLADAGEILEALRGELL